MLQCMLELHKPESVGLCSKRFERLSNEMHSQVEQGTFAGISTLVARKNKVVHFEQFGQRDREAQLPIEPDTLFRIYSMTKPIITVAFMTLYEQGLCDLAEPVAKYIPAFSQLKVLDLDSKGKHHFKPLQQPVTIYHLLTHTAGLAYDFYTDNPVCQYYREANLLADTKGVSLETFVNKICQLPLAFQPGTQWYYSVSVDVIARLIEVISGQRLDVFLQQNVFNPLQMNDTGFFQPEAKRSRVASVYGGVDLCAPGTTWEKLAEVWVNKVNQKLDVSLTNPVDDPDFYRGGLGLTTTAKDYYRFCQTLLNQGKYQDGYLLSPKTLEFMNMNHLKDDMLPIGFQELRLFGYGFGIGSRVLQHVPAIQVAGTVGEFGWAGAATTYYFIDPKEELIALFFTQRMCSFSNILHVFQALVYQTVIE